MDLLADCYLAVVKCCTLQHLLDCPEIQNGHMYDEYDFQPLIPQNTKILKRNCGTEEAHSAPTSDNPTTRCKAAGRMTPEAPLLTQLADATWSRFPFSLLPPPDAAESLMWGGEC